MKTPLIDYTTRLIARKFPKSFTADRVEFTIAKYRFEREIGRELEPLVKCMASALDAFSKLIKFR